MSQQQSGDDRFMEDLGKPCPETNGTRVEIISMRNDPDPIPYGTRGTVTGGNGSQIFVNWDNGRSVILLVGQDVYKIVGKPRR